MRDSDYVKGKLFQWLDLPSLSVRRDMERLLPGLCVDHLLDVGCGTQPYRDLLNCSVTYCGLDDVSALHFGYMTPDTTYAYLDGVWPECCSGGSQGAVLCTEVLEHAPFPERTLRKIYQALRPSGTLVLTTPFAVRRHFSPRDYRRWTAEGLFQLLSSVGFTAIDVRPRGNPLTVACAKVYGLGRRWPWLAPLCVFAALVGRLSLRMAGDADDCLGFTATARRP